MATYQSSIKNLRVSFPPQQFGYGVNNEGEKAPYPCVLFENGSFSTKSEILISLLDKHVGNGTSFFKLNTDAESVLNAQFGNIQINAKNLTLTDEDQGHIKTLQDAASKLTVRNLNHYKKSYLYIVDRLDVSGVFKLADDIKPSKLKARILDVLAAIEDEELIK